MKETKKDIILKASDFKYPSKEEVKSINQTFIEPFGFESTYELIAIFNRIPMEIVLKNKLLAEWDNLLINKAGNLYSSYENSLVHYNRIIDSTHEDDKNYKIVNRIQFDFFSEVYFYFFHAIKDTIGQLLKVYYDLKCEEKNITFYNVSLLLKAKELDIHILSQIFLINTKTSTEIRHSFTHRFPSNSPDFRPSLSESGESRTYKAGTGKHFTTQEIAKNITSSYTFLKEYMVALRKIIENHKTSENKSVDAGEINE